MIMMVENMVVIEKVIEKMVEKAMVHDPTWVGGRLGGGTFGHLHV